MEPISSIKPRLNKNSQADIDWDYGFSYSDSKGAEKCNISCSDVKETVSKLTSELTLRFTVEKKLSQNFTGEFDIFGAL